MIVDAVSVVPEVFGPYMDASILGRARRAGGVAGIGVSAHGEGPGCAGGVRGGGDKAEQKSGGGKRGKAPSCPADARGAVHAASIAGAPPGVHEKPSGGRMPVKAGPWGDETPGRPRGHVPHRDRLPADGQKDAWASPQSLLVFTEQGGNYVQ